MNDTQLAHLAVLTKLNQMMRDRCFDIITLDNAIKTLGSVPDGRAYQILRQLHCVNWMDMPPELRDAVPALIERCVSVPAYQFKSTPLNPDQSARITAGIARMLTQ